MHAGLNPDRTITIDEINRTVEQEVRSWDELATRSSASRRASAILHAAGDHQRGAGRDRQDRHRAEDRRAAADYVTPEFVRRLQFLTSFDKLALIEADGPLWYRGLATMPEDQQPAVDALLQRHGAAASSSATRRSCPGRIRARFGGQVVLIDTGMLTSYFKGGQPSALEIQDGG